MLMPKRIFAFLLFFERKYKIEIKNMPRPRAVVANRIKGCQK
jgi:hypothetical protein